MTFDGFTTPTKNYFPMPNVWIDICAEINNLAELKVIQYVLRHTWGYKEYGVKKAITTDEFMHGRKRTDGSRMDKGTGLSNRSVIDGLRAAIDHGYIEYELDEADKARKVKSYALKMAQSYVKYLHIETDELDVKKVHIGCEESSYPGEVSSHLAEDTSYRSEKETRERNLEKDTKDKQEDTKINQNGHSPNKVADATPPSLSLISDSVVTTGKTENDNHFHIADTKAEPTKPDEKEATSRQHDTLKVRVEKMYKVFDTLFRELMNDPSYKEPRTDKSTKAIKALIQAEATDERIRFVLMDIWNDPDAFWQKHRTITSVASQYSTRVSKMTLKNVSNGHKRAVSPTANTTYTPPTTLDVERNEKKRQELLAKSAEIRAAREAATQGK